MSNEFDSSLCFFGFSMCVVNIEMVKLSIVMLIVVSRVFLEDLIIFLKDIGYGFDGIEDCCSGVRNK